MDNEKREYCVYKHTSKIDGRAFVGITRVGVKQRWKSGGVGYKTQKYFWAYICKYGWDSLTHEVLYDNLTEDEAIAKEIELIAKWDLTNKEKGFNLDLGGSTNNHFWKGVYCVETHKTYGGTRIAEREIGISANNICYACNGKREYANRDDKGNKLHWVYTDEMERIPDIIEKCRFEKENLDNKEERMFEGYKQKCIRKSKPRIVESIRKSVYQYDLQGNLLAIYSGLAEASQKSGCNMTEIGQRCNGNGRTCGGYLWNYKPRTFTESELREAQNCCNHQTILQYTFDMKLVKEYIGGYELAEESPSRYKHIRAVCNRTQESAYGYVWRFKGETPEQYEADKKYYADKCPAPKNAPIDNQIVKVFDSLTDTEKEGWGRNMVSLCCRGKKDIYRGYKWKYLTEVT